MSKSSKSTKDKRDIYYRQSKAEGYRARSAFKLIHLDEQFGFLSAHGHSLRERASNFNSSDSSSSSLFKESHVNLRSDHDSAKETQEQENGRSFIDLKGLEKSSWEGFSSPPSRVADLCAAPGSWSQVMRQKLPSSSKIISVDLQPMAPINGVTCIQGDITRQETVREVEKALNQTQDNSTSELTKCRADLVVCDGANDVTGLGFLDEILQSQLLLAALQISLRLLSPNGCFISKIFTHSDSDHSNDGEKSDGNSGSLLRAQFRTLFEAVEIVKPISSRAGSGEHFLVCLGFKPPEGLGFGLDGEETTLVSLLTRAEETLRNSDGKSSSKEQTLREAVPFIASGDLSGYNKLLPGAAV